MRHNDTIGLYKYWNEIRGDRAAPLRSDISPAALGRLLPSVMLLERTPDDEIVFRLAGTQVCGLRCRELRGASFTNLFRSDDHATLSKVLHSVDHGDTIIILDAAARTRDGNAVSLEIALFPLADETTRILGSVAMNKTPFWFGAKPTQFKLQGIRYMDPKADLMYLQSRPSVPVSERRQGNEPRKQRNIRLLAGSGQEGPKRALRIFTVHEGGKK